MVGDLNIAPLETDVWNHKALLKVVSHTPVEVERLGRVFAAGPWVDALRHYVPAEERLYTWWSYRSPDWAKADKGRRLDHIWTSQSLAPPLTRHEGPAREPRLGAALGSCAGAGAFRFRRVIPAPDCAKCLRVRRIGRRPEVDQRPRPAGGIKRLGQAIFVETRGEIGLIRRLVEARVGGDVILLRTLRHDIAWIEPAALVDRQRRLVAGIDDGGMVMMLMRRQSAGSRGEGARAAKDAPRPARTSKSNA